MPMRVKLEGAVASQLDNSVSSLALLRLIVTLPVSLRLTKLPAAMNCALVRITPDWTSMTSPSGRLAAVTSKAPVRTLSVSN